MCSVSYRTPSSARAPSFVSSSAKLLSTDESGTLGPVFSCSNSSAPNTAQIVYGDRTQFQQLASGEFSIDVWVKISSSSNTQISMYLMSYGSQGTSSEVSVLFVPSMVNSGNFDPRLCVSGLCWTFDVVQQLANGSNISVSVAKNEWRHYAFAYAPSDLSPQAKCYVDGQSTSVLLHSSSLDPSGPSASLELCQNGILEFDLLRIVPDSTRFSVSNTVVPFNPPHQDYHFTCPPLQAPPNGGLSCSGYVVGSSCITSCKRGYSFEQPFTAQRTCSALGQWSGSASACIPLSVSATPDSLTLSAIPDATGHPSSVRLLVRLESRIDSDVQLPVASVPLNSAGSELLSISPPLLLFTPTNWHTTQIILVSANAVSQRRVYSPVELLMVQVGPATGSNHYAGFPVTPVMLTFTWVNSELYQGAFYLFSPWFSSEHSCEAHSRASPGQNTTINPTQNNNVTRTSTNTTAAPRLATNTVLSISPAFFVAYGDRPAIRIGDRAFHLDFWASIPASLTIPLIHYSQSQALLPGVSDSDGFSVSLSSAVATFPVRVTMNVCIAGQCASCSHQGQNHEWKHYTVSRDPDGSTKCFINGQRVVWNGTLNIWLTGAMPGSSSYMLYVGGNDVTAQQSVSNAYMDLLRLYVEPQPTSLTVFPQMSGELSLLDCGLINTVGANILCNGSQGLIGDFCNIQCPFGARIVNFPEIFRVMTCQTNRQWDVDPHPSCELDCPTLTVSNGMTTCMNGFEIYTFNRTCTVTCNPGYNLVGSSGNIVCSSGGMWSDPDLQCLSPVTSTATPATTII